jgi:AcrR family transcriptional regulator
MPKETFFNLSDEKRHIIQNAALNEFADHGYEGASINRIVAAAGIAKGSFYQYFEDKADLFKQILTYIGELKMAYVSPVLLNPTEFDFFTLLEELYRTGLAFGREHPKAAKLGFEVNENKTSQVFKELLQESRQMATGFFMPILDLAIERGEVRPDIDKQFVIHMMIQMQLASFDYYLEYRQGESVDDDIMPTINLMLDFIRNGIGAGSSKPDGRNKGENNQ